MSSNNKKLIAVIGATGQQGSREAESSVLCKPAANSRCAL